MKRRANILRVGALCALVACVSDAHFVAAEHDDVGAPNFGLFDFASQFISTASSGAEQTPPIFTAFHSSGGNWDGFLAAARALARGDTGQMTASFIDAALRGESSPNSTGLWFRDTTANATTMTSWVNNTDDELEMQKRMAFRDIFNDVLNSTASSMYNVIDPDSVDPTGESFRAHIVEAVSDATTFGDMIFDASTESNRRAAIMLYDRVASQMFRSRAILRSAASGDVTAANELFFGVADGPFTNSNSQWTITSATTRDGDVEVESTNDDSLRGIKAYVLIAVGIVCVLSAAALFARRSSKRRSLVVDAEPSATTANRETRKQTETLNERDERIDALKHVL